MTVNFGLHSFRSKLIFFFTTLILLPVAVIVFLVTDRLHEASEKKIDDEIRITVNVLSQIRQTQLQNSSQAAATLIRDNTSLRGYITDFNEEDLFDEGPSIEEKYSLLHDSVSDFQIFEESPLFIITDAQGTVLYQKGSQDLLGDDISQWPEIQIALQGEEDLFTWWGKDSPIYMETQDTNTSPSLYEVFFKPVKFGNQVFGLLIIGFDTAEQPNRIQRITNSEITFFQGNHLYSTSAPFKLHSVLKSLAPQFSALEMESTVHFLYKDEEFLAVVHHVLDGLERTVGNIVIFRSKTHELSFFEEFSDRLNYISIGAVIVGIIFALLFSRQVSQAVNILSNGAQEVANGNLDIVLPVTSRDELGNLAVTFNKMTSGLKEKEHITQTFKKYVSSTVVDEVLKSDVELGGEKKEVTIYFTDLANFTAISEKLAPEELISFLNHYLSRMTQLLEDHSGVVDKYIGDAIMAFWGAPLPLPDHPKQACITALQQKLWHEELHEQWKAHPELSSIKTRFGIHTGEVIVGNVGSERRLDYTIIGDSVNIASRLEALNKYYGTQILISEATHDALNNDMLTREIDLVQVKGKNEAIRIYELMTFAENSTSIQKKLAKSFNHGREAYLQRDFKEALKIFTNCQSILPKDQPSQIMIERCQSYLKAPPDASWSGIQIMMRK